MIHHTGSQRRPSRGGRRWPWITAVAVTVALGATALIVDQQSGASADNLAGQAVISASSTGSGSSPASLADGRGGQLGQYVGRDWVSDGQTIGASTTFRWKSPRVVSRITIEQSTDTSLAVVAGFLTFSDGSALAVRFEDGKSADLTLSPRETEWMTFTISQASEGATAVGLAEIRAFTGSEQVQDSRGAGNVALASTATSAGETAIELTDGNTTSFLGKEWITDTRAPVILSWPVARELASVQLVGATSSEAPIASGWLGFSDKSRIRVGEVLEDPRYPTTVAFMPRLTTSVTFTPDEGESGTVGLSELRAFTIGSTPFRALADPAAPATFPKPCGASSNEKPGEGRITIRCPSSTSQVSGVTKVSLYAPGMARVTARVWSPDADQTSSVTTTTTGPQGAAEFEFDADEAENGPITLRIQGFESKDEASAPSDSAITYLQLYNTGGRSATTPEDPTTSRGMTLAFSEEFTNALSISRDGSNADYAASKPEPWGAGEFGDAVFADPDLDLGNVSVVGNDYLRLSTSRLPQGVEDDQGWDRDYVGGILASARPGGSGFSAEYGYFETRMLAPVGEGTWPAFWTLPSPNLIEKDEIGAEVDVVELYGHDPVGACVATHTYFEGGEDKNILCDERFDSVRSAMGWHTYGARVTPTDIIYYLDGREIERVPQVNAGDRPLFFMVNLALGGGWPIDLDDVDGRTSLYVDYIRVYT